MWSSKTAVIVGALALTACGYAPVYGPGAASSDLRGRIDIADPADEEGFALVKRLEERLGQPSGADLNLTADIRLDEEAVGFLPDGTISRYNVIGRVDWALAQYGRAIATGDEQAFTSYSATSTTVATTFAQRDARERLMVILADRIISDLIAVDLP